MLGEEPRQASESVGMGDLSRREISFSTMAMASMACKEALKRLLETLYY
jgi:hypothetical protein